MRRTLLLALAIFTGTLCVAQFTQDDFPRQAGFIDEMTISSSTFDVLSHGTDQLWDFSSAVTEDYLSREYFDATDDPFYENALNYRQRDLSFQGFLIESTEYEVVDENGYSALGIAITDVSYSLEAITGGADDELHFVGGNYPFGGSNDYVVFPFDYQDEWTINYQRFIPYELTVAGFGLNATPGEQIRYFTEEREIVGEGSFIIPDENGDASDPIPGYLLRAVRTSIDSVFLAGDNPPQALLDAFGLVQGATVVDSFYVAYVPGFGSPLFSLDIMGDETGNLFYRAEGAEFGVDPNSVGELDHHAISAYPNPAAKGQLLKIVAETTQPVRAIQLVSFSGQTVHEESLNTDLRHGANIVIPGDLVSGLYLINLLNARGETIGQSKVVVH